MHAGTDRHARDPDDGEAPRVAQHPLHIDEIALFLDLDGTLVEFVLDPASLHIAPDLVALLARLRARLGGALALVSGRPLAELDRLFAPLVLPAAGVHGFERRDAAGHIHRRTATTTLDGARDALQRALAALPGTLLEDKGSALALHYRRAPEARAQLEALAERVLAALGPDYERIDGDCVVELKPAASTKGSAVSGFMAEAPFAGRVPVFVGDDLTDADGFSAARRLGGLAIAVGPRVDAPYRLADPRALRGWLEQLPQAQDVRP